MMPAFSRPMLSRSVAQKLCVVDVDAGDDRAVGIDHVRPHPGALRVRLRESATSRQGMPLIKRRMASVVNSKYVSETSLPFWILAASTASKCGTKSAARDNFAMHPAALFEVHQMR
jgi:hypothetical protein